ncbi:Glycosyl transferase family 2 [Gemmata sp. SH-PL17]|uniref:glycosyltransferase family 2 protein n=1 Tax=Gemmata sp. SH-PL17 TaxID=1630693 RepID=UPI00078CD5E0|nr:glycosyltransferase family A protein [Gemmata sp. SH-PL17]AMV24169.1 Glycosyl transferase family 2 [Gemmata sp. SH-PL17]
MGEFSVSVVIATISRPTLARTLGSLRGQAWGPGDEVLVVGDGSQPVARELFEQFGLPGRFVENPGPTGTWGHHARNWVLDTRLARGAYLMALDDDDEYHPGALAAVRRALGENPGRPHIFRMTGHPLNPLLWARPVLEVGNLGTPMLVFPNDPARLGRYGMWGAGDFDFCAQTCAHFPDGPVWREEPVCMVRPWGARAR